MIYYKLQINNVIGKIERFFVKISNAFNENI